MIELLIALIIVGAVLYLLQLVPIDGTIKTIIQGYRDRRGADIRPASPWRARAWLMPEYNPRSKNPPIDGTRQSWSTAFDDRVAMRREQREPAGFRLPKGDKQ